MNEPAYVEIPVREFDLSLLPEQARQPGTDAFRNAVAVFFQQELGRTAEFIQVSVDAQLIRVTWRTEANIDPLRLAVLRLKAGDYPRGVQLLRLALKLNPEDAEVRYNLGMALSDLGQLDEAIAQLQRAVEIRPSVADTRVALGVALYRKGLVAEAKPVLEAALDLEPDNPYALRNLAGCLLKLSEAPDRAVQMLRKAMQLLPEDQQAWIGFAQALGAQGNDEESDRAYIRAIEINPHNQLAEIAKSSRSQIAQRTMREAVGGGVRPDAVMYCVGALEKCRGMGPAEIQEIAFEIAALGTKGINPNDSSRKYRLRTLSGEFTGLHLLCYLYVTWKQIRPDMDIGFDLSKEYEAARAMLSSRSNG